jgi:hypothetical protein
MKKIIELYHSTLVASTQIILFFKMGSSKKKLIIRQTCAEATTLVEYF